MEKINAIIDKLQELKNTGADLQSLSYYTQLLQAEILQARTLQQQQAQQQRHIAVIMPGHPIADTAIAHHNGNNTAHTTNGATHVDTPVSTASITVETAATVHQHQPAPPIVETPQVIVTPPEPAPAPEPRPVEPQRPAPVVGYHPATTVTPPPATTPVYETKQPIPVTVTPPPAPEPVPATDTNLRKELHELAAQTNLSLNDKLRQSRQELGARFADAPVKDLRQAIGINDKFLFIQELFRGDVDVYERSIKTINECQSLQEAEYWIERELKIRQGWQEDMPAVHHFYSLVKKRFS
ncbi:hypothetical protein KTO58_19465 [Chitinophaga pendula]|uniref:hypothetical protein n=1 Tax=Chitinophaga TaxID=79328 RepID=UPI000BB0B4DE|nr:MULTISPECIES: hypothetical protein [Chitinophaga]ASZ11152.1 hypothetical protein CK934_09345 [Chitinophaga sp. MD30]UCJ05851.1 hypothetical protein KTO58_19465 [Chitinophaga pendula]